MNDSNNTGSSASGSGQVLVRNYTSSDYGKLIPLLAAVYNSRISQAEMETNYISDNAEILLAVIDDVVVGCSFLEYRTDYVRESHTVFITYVAVDEAFRHRGIGTSLFREIEARAKTRGCSALELTSADSRVAAHAFYHSLQFTRKKTTVFIKEL